MAGYIDPMTNFGFQRLFCQEDSRDILKQFLFDVLELAHPIQEVTHLLPAQLPVMLNERMSVYGFYCIDEVGQTFVVEIQRGSQTFIPDRVLYYSTFPIIHQARKGTSWQFELIPIYCIAILNFTLDIGAEYLRRIQLMDVDKKEVFYDKLTYIYIELPNFGLQPEELVTEADRWIYLLQNMPELQDIPAELAKESFTKAFEIAREAALSPRERLLYEASLKSARDAYAELVSARDKGLTEGRAEGRVEGRAEGRAEGRIEVRQEIARSMLARNLELKLIMDLTGFTAEEIARLR